MTELLSKFFNIKTKQVPVGKNSELNSNELNSNSDNSFNIEGAIEAVEGLASNNIESSKDGSIKATSAPVFSPKEIGSNTVEIG